MSPLKADIKPASTVTDPPRLEPRSPRPQQATPGHSETWEDLLSASRTYFEILRNQPHDLETLHSAAHTTLKLGEAKSAMIFCDRALALGVAEARKASHLLLIRGVAHRLLGQPVASLTDLDAAASLNPGNPEIAQQLALTLGELEPHTAEPDAYFENCKAPSPAGSP